MGKGKRLNKARRMIPEDAYAYGYRRGFGRCLALVIWAMRKRKPFINEDEIKSLLLSKKFTVANKNERLLLQKKDSTLSRIPSERVEVLKEKIKSEEVQRKKRGNINE
jgi:hypothetical protein